MVWFWNFHFLRTGIPQEIMSLVNLHILLCCIYLSTCGMFGLFLCISVIFTCLCGHTWKCLILKTQMILDSATRCTDKASEDGKVQFCWRSHKSFICCFSIDQEQFRWSRIVLCRGWKLDATGQLMKNYKGTSNYLPGILVFGTDNFLFCRT